MSAFVDYPDELPVSAVTGIITAVKAIAGGADLSGQIATIGQNVWNVQGYGQRVLLGMPVATTPPTSSPGTPPTGTPVGGGGFTPGTRPGRGGGRPRNSTQPLTDNEAVSQLEEMIDPTDGPQKALDPSMWQPILMWLIQWFMSKYKP